MKPFNLALALLFSLSLCCYGEAATTKIRSVKALTHMLSNIEKRHGKIASFCTMRLQIYLEDVYISQGTTLYIQHQVLSDAIAKAISQDLSKSQISKLILRQFQQSKFNE